MSDRPSISALVPAAGSGERLGLGPKAFLEIEGRPLLAWVAEKMAKVAGEVILAIPEERLDEAASLCPDCRCIPGAESRQETIERLAEGAQGDVLLIQDLVRPFCSTGLLQRVCATASEYGVAGAFLPAQVPVARISGDSWVEDSLPAEGSAIFQAPQAFKRDLLASLHETAAARGWKAQSTIELALKAGIPVRAVEGEVQNIKITTQQDWQLARLLSGYLA